MNSSELNREKNVQPYYDERFAGFTSLKPPSAPPAELMLQDEFDKKRKIPTISDNLEDSKKKRKSATGHPWKTVKNE